MAQVSIDGISFIDRNVTGEVVLGPWLGAIAVMDYDRDDFPDLVIGGSTPTGARLFRNAAHPQRPGLRTYVDVTSGSGLDGPDAWGGSHGIIVADYDNDGDMDIYNIASRTGSHGLLLGNNGNNTFSNVSQSAGVRRFTGSPLSASWNDYDLDGYVDLLICGIAEPYIYLLRNNGNGTFSDVSSLLPPVLGFDQVYSHLWTDYDADGYADCFIITRSGAGHDVVLKNVDDGAGGRRFANVAETIGFVSLGPAPMGISAGDFDADGDLDLGISDAIVGTYFENRGTHVQRISPFATMFGWGVAWIDVDNDRDVDFYTAGSWSRSAFDNLQRNLRGGQFDNISSVLNTASLPTRYSVQLDFNNDGRQDIVAVNPSVSVSVYENVSTTGNHWLRLSLNGDGTRVNRSAIGAFVRLWSAGVVQVRELVSGSSTTGTEDLRLHFGLGTASAVDAIEIIWPRRGSLISRTERYIGPFAADQPLRVVPTYEPGDLNCDASVNAFDIQPFITALQSEAEFGPSLCSINNADINQDGSVNPFDISGFIGLLSR